MIIRAWAEYLSPREAMEPEVMSLLKKYDVIIGMAFPPDSMNSGFETFLGKYQEQGIKVMLWPLLEDALGYWPSERNAKEYAEYVDRICDWADSKKIGFPWLAIDMEPPVLQMKALKDGSIPEKIKAVSSFLKDNRERGRFYDTSATFNRLIERLHGRGIKVAAAAGDMTAADIATGGIGFQDTLETPISTLNFDLISFMIYTSMITGYSKGLVTPSDARWHLYSTMSEMKKALWSRAGVSIGVTYVGKFEDEPYYKTPEDLLPDMRAAKAALIEDIAIYNLEGILKYPRPEEWFETLLNAEPEIPDESLKVKMAHSIARVAARLL